MEQNGTEISPIRMGALEEDLKLDEKTREMTRVVIAFIATSSLLIIVIFPFCILWKMDAKFEDLRELLHILIPPLIGVFGAIAGFYFGERNMG